MLTSPGGIGRLVETLDDSREIIRNGESFSSHQSSPPLLRWARCKSQDRKLIRAYRCRIIALDHFAHHGECRDSETPRVRRCFRQAVLDRQERRRNRKWRNRRTGLSRCDRRTPTMERFESSQFPLSYFSFSSLEIRKRSQFTPFLNARTTSERPLASHSSHHSSSSPAQTLSTLTVSLPSRSNRGLNKKRSMQDS